MGDVSWKLMVIYKLMVIVFEMLQSFAGLICSILPPGLLLSFLYIPIVFFLGKFVPNPFHLLKLLQL